MTSGQSEMAKTFEIIEIAEQIVQNMTFGRPEIVETSETVEILKHLKLFVCIPLFCHTPKFFSETDPPKDLNTSKYSSKRSSLGI